ncbi:hypothetical protein COBT_001628 [Conglomerata obtusa]
MKRKFEKNIVMYQIQNHDFQKVLFDNNTKVISKKITKLILSKLLHEVDEYKVTGVIKNMTLLLRTSIEYQLCFDESFFEEFFFNYKIACHQIDTFLNFLKHINKKIFKTLSYNQVEFLRHNFCNYYVYKYYLNDFCFDFSLDLNYLTEKEKFLFKNLLNKIIDASKDIETFRKYIDAIKNLNIKNLIHNIIIEHTTHMQSQQKNIDNFCEINLNNFICYKNSLNNICNICKRKLNFIENVTFIEKFDEVIDIKLETILLDDKFEELHFLIIHVERARTYKIFKHIIHKIYNDIHNVSYYKVLYYFDLEADEEKCNLLNELFKAIVSEYNDNQLFKTTSIINNLILNSKIVLSTFNLLYTFFFKVESSYAKIQIMYLIKKHYDIYNKNIKIILEFYMSYYFSYNDTIPNGLNNIASIFGIDSKTFFLEHLYYFIPIIIEYDLQSHIEENYVKQIIPFMVVNLLKKCEFNSASLIFGYDCKKLLVKFGSFVCSIVILEGCNFDYCDSFFKPDIKTFLSKSCNQILFTLRKLYLEHRFMYPNCIFRIFLNVINILDDDFYIHINQFIPFVEFFIEKENYDTDCNYKKNCSMHQCKKELLDKIYAHSKNFGYNYKNQIIKSYIDLESECSTLKFNELFSKLKSLALINNSNLSSQISKKIEKLICIYLFSPNQDFEFNEVYSIKYNFHNYKALIDFCSENNNNQYFLEFLNQYYKNYNETVSGITLLGKLCVNIEKTYKYSKKIKTVKDFNTSSVAIFLLENYLCHIDNENQDIFFYVIQETLKFVNDKKMIKDSVFINLKQFLDTQYHYEFEIEYNNVKQYNYRTKYKEYIFDLFISLLNKIRTFENIFKLLKLGYLFNNSIMEVYVLMILKAMKINNIEINLNFDVQKIDCITQDFDGKILDFLLKANLLLNFEILDTNSVVKICILRKNYYHLVKYLEFNSEFCDNQILLQFVYYKIKDFDDCKAINEKSSFFSEINLFYELCLENDYKSALELFMQKSSNLSKYKYLITNIVNDPQNDVKEYTITDLYNENLESEKVLQKWNLINDETVKMDLIHVKHDLEIFKSFDDKNKALEIIELRRKHTKNKIFFLEKHHEFIKLIKNNFEIEFKKIECNEKSEQEYIEIFEIRIILEKIKYYRKQRNYTKCKELINYLTLKGEHRVLYEKAKFKIINNQKYEAIRLLKMLEEYCDKDDIIYTKCIITHARLSENKEIFEGAISKIKESEKLFFYRGKFYERNDKIKALESFLCCMQLGRKYNNEILPKMFFLLTENEELRAENNKLINDYFKKASLIFLNYFNQIDINEFINIFNDIVPKINHPNDAISKIIVKILEFLYTKYPQKSFWLSLIIYNTDQKETKAKINVLLSSLNLDLRVIFKKILDLSRKFNEICEFKIKNQRELSLTNDFSFNIMYNEGICIPNTKFNTNISGFLDKINVYSSLQSPKKLTLKGENGKLYSILCKPNDDLRKDNRFMDLNRTLNNIFKMDDDCILNNLYIRTYSVIPFTHKNGIIEWIDGLTSLKNICEDEYKLIDKSIVDIQRKFRSKKKIGHNEFNDVCNQYQPVLYKWFYKKEDPYDYYITKKNFTRTYAVMNVVGWFMGLGDRHLENIMIDSLTGDTFHVDLNCLFEKAKKLDVPERVPFRLTQNIVHAFGPAGIDGTYKASMVACLKAMIKNRDLIIANLMLFLYDPLHEWKGGRKKVDDSVKAVIDNLINKLNITDIRGMIEKLNCEATDIYNLSNMYIGWCSFI